MTRNGLAMFGGPRAVPRERAAKDLVGWPVITDAERHAVVGVLDSGQFTSNNPGSGQVQLLEREWADLVGTAHCAAVSNGTTALELALAAAGVEPGSEILVPALSFIASAVAPVHRLVVPVFVDIDPVTFTMDPRAAAAAITPRTAAILAVHLHGLPCDMDELNDLARRHDLLLVEDAAQAHAAQYRGTRTGALGDVAAFSLNVVKNLPTCGEGGLITTDDSALHNRLLRHRQFGEQLEGRGKRDYISHELAGNAKLSAIQAAFTRCQLDRLEEYHQARDRNVRAMLDRLSVLPGLQTPHCPDDRTHAWHILRFRFSPGRMGIEDASPGAVRAAVERVMRAEGVPLQQYQPVPLPEQEALVSRKGFGGYPWKLRPGEYGPTDTYPNTLAVIEDSLTLQRWHLNPAAGPVLQDCAAAFEKVWANLDQVATLARAMSPTPSEAVR
ncbi:dTDP-3-amino-3,6-dideoxy-alpha-D-galactopyranose transaminase [Streptomyces sp. YIM 130001]|nr:dTDP-3-amino-3,6-dideoxy-alpha-D-galactopyranose transaminase [Streptomyces sp. YIM 130001]